MAEETYGICVMCWQWRRLTSEHAYPLWIFKGLDTSSVQWARDNVPTPERELIDVEIYALCHKCNTGWLSTQFEQKVGKWLQPSLLDTTREVILDPSQRRVTATWAIKTALLLELALAEYRGEGFAPASHFEWIFENRTPPPGCGVWMFCVDIREVTPGRSLYSWTKALHLNPPPLSGPTAPQGYLATFTAGYIGFQVLGFDFGDREDLAGSTFRFRLPDGLKIVMRQLWPPEPGKPRSFFWPFTRAGGRGTPVAYVAPQFVSMDNLSSWPIRNVTPLIFPNAVS